jgi:branched-chain amino acid transport system permease protein
MAKKSWFLPAILGIVAVALPPFLGGYFQHILILVMMWIAMAAGWNLLGGYCGQVSFGSAVCFGLGAYGAGLLYFHWGISPWWGMIAGPLLAIIVAIPIGLVTFRLRGGYFVLATLALAEAIRIVFLQWVEMSAGPLGVVIERTWGMEKLPYYYIILAIAALSLYLVYRLLKSKFGYYFISIREDQDAAEGLGIPSTKYKMYALIPSTGIIGLAGAFYMNYMAFIEPNVVFPLVISVTMVLSVMLGGPGTFWGPALGAAIYVLLSEVLRAFAGPVIGTVHYLIFALILVLVIMFLPNGIAGEWDKIKRVFRGKKPVYVGGE